jgi:hypothetical protein
MTSGSDPQDSCITKLPEKIFKTPRSDLRDSILLGLERDPGIKILPVRVKID